MQKADVNHTRTNNYSPRFDKSKFIEVAVACEVVSIFKQLVISPIKKP